MQRQPKPSSSGTKTALISISCNRSRLLLLHFLSINNADLLDLVNDITTYRTMENHLNPVRKSYVGSIANGQECDVSCVCSSGESSLDVHKGPAVGEQVAISGAVLEGGIVVKMRFGRRLEHPVPVDGIQPRSRAGSQRRQVSPRSCADRSGEIIINVTSQVRVIVYGAERSIR